MLSKGHGGPVLYMALAYRGYFPKEHAFEPQRRRHQSAQPRGPHPNARHRYDRRLARPGTVLRVRDGAGGAGLTAASTRCSASSATARATRARYGRPQCSPGTQARQSDRDHATTTSCRSTASPMTCSPWSRSRISGKRSTGKCWRWTATIGTTSTPRSTRPKQIKGKPVMIIAHTIKAKDCSVGREQAGKP